MRILALLTLLLSAADHWTTYLCLRSPVSGWKVSEANPISDWLFETLGLVPALMLDSVFTLGAVLFLLSTQRVPELLKGTVLSIIAAFTGYAVINNLNAIEALGLSPLG